MINEKDYQTFSWIQNNINHYRDTNHSYDRAAIHPFKASPMSAITGLYIISSTMHPIYGYQLHSEMEKFLREKCTDTNFLDKHRISVVICEECNNSNLTKIHENIYIYPGLYEKTNILI